MPMPISVSNVSSSQHEKHIHGSDKRKTQQSLLESNPNARQIRTPRLLIRRNHLHMRVIRLKHQPLVTVLGPRIPIGRSSQTIRVRIERPDEACPVRLDDGHNGRVCRRVARGGAAVDVGWAPDRVYLYCMRYSVTGLCSGRIDDVPVVCGGFVSRVRGGGLWKMLTVPVACQTHVGVYA